MQSETDIEFPPFWLDLCAEKLWRDTREVALRPKTFALLRYLAEHPERLSEKRDSSATFGARPVSITKVCEITSVRFVTR